MGCYKYYIDMVGVWTKKYVTKLHGPLVAKIESLFYVVWPLGDFQRPLNS